MKHDLHVNPENPAILSIKPSQFLQDYKMSTIYMSISKIL